MFHCEPEPETKTPKRPRRRSPSELEAKCDRWNAAHAVGTAVDVQRADGTITRTTTRDEAFVCDSGFAVIFLEGISGYYSLDLVKLVK